MHYKLHWLLPFLVAFPISQLPVGAQSTQPEQTEKFELNKQIIFANRPITARVSLVQLKIGNQAKPAWCYQTYGMAEVKHPELFVLVLKKNGEADSAFPHGPIKMLGGLAKARASEPYNELDFTPYPCFPGTKFVGAVLVPYDHLQGPQVPSGSLALVAITAEELQVAQLAGPTRVKAALAQQTSYYPCPIWCDRQRASTFTQADLSYMKKDPTVSHLNPVGTFGSVLLRNEDEFSLRISKDEGKMLAQSLQKYKGQVRINLCFDPRAGAFKVWPPEGAKGPTAVAPGQPDASMLSGSFVAVVGGADKNSVRQVADGFLLQISEADTNKLISAMATGGAYSVDVSEDAKKFSLAWITEHYHNPIDGKDYRPSNGWVTYSPRGERTDKLPPATAAKTVAINHIVLLTSDDILSRAITVESLAAYTKSLEKASIAQLEKMHPINKQTVTIQCDLSPGNVAEFKVAVSPSEDGIGPVIKSLYSGLNATKAPGCKHKIAFQLVIDVPASTANKK